MLDVGLLNEISDLNSQKASLKESMDQCVWEKYVERDLYKSADEQLKNFEDTIMKAADKGNKAINIYDFYVVDSLLKDRMEKDISSAFNENKSSLAKRGYRPKEGKEDRLAYDGRISNYKNNIETIGCLMALKNLQEQGFTVKCVVRPVHKKEEEKNAKPYPGHYNISVDWSKVSERHVPSQDFHLETAALKEEVEALKALDSLQEKYISVQSENKALKLEVSRLEASMPDSFESVKESDSEKVDTLNQEPVRALISTDMATLEQIQAKYHPVVEYTDKEYFLVEPFYHGNILKELGSLIESNPHFKYSKALSKDRSMQLGLLKDVCSKLGQIQDASEDGINWYQARCEIERIYDAASNDYEKKQKKSKKQAGFSR